MREKSKRKVLFLASWYPSKEQPTLGNFVQKHAEVANEIADIDVLYAVASSTVEELFVSDEVMNNVRTIIVYYPKVQSKIPFIASILKKEAYHNALKKGYNHLEKQYDWIHLNAVFPAGIFARWIKKKFGTPYVATVHWTGFLPHHQVYVQLPYFIRKVYQSIFKDANKILAVSDHLGRALQDLGLINHFEVLNNVVNDVHFYPSDKKMNKNDPIRFLHISTFDNTHKNISGMLSAFRQLKKDHLLHLITEGEEKEVWEMLEKHEIPQENCIVESQLPVEKVGEAMRLADCFVLFSNYETFSVVLAEAWSSGIPAIYSRCGGLTEINNPALGNQISVGNEEMLLQALLSFSPSDYEAKRILDFSKQFSKTDIKKQLKSIYLSN